MLRRILSFGVCLGLLGLGPTALSLCAMQADLPAECSTKPTASPDCEHMAAHHPSADLAPADLANCCAVKAAPSPDAVTVAKQIPAMPSQLEVLPAKAFLLQGRTELAHPADSPPRTVFDQRQPLLCVFLI